MIIKKKLVRTDYQRKDLDSNWEFKDESIMLNYTDELFQERIVDSISDFRNYGSTSELYEPNEQRVTSVSSDKLTKTIFELVAYTTLSAAS